MSERSSSESSIQLAVRTSQNADGAPDSRRLALGLFRLPIIPALCHDAPWHSGHTEEEPRRSAVYPVCPGALEDRVVIDHTTVDRDDGTGDIACAIGRKKDDQIGDFFGFGKTSHRPVGVVVGRPTLIAELQ